MQTLARYLGNKTDLLVPITTTVQELAKPGDLVCDIFSGSLTVSLELKRLGFRVAANDINLFSAVFARAFLTNSEVPRVPLKRLVPKVSLDDACRAAEARLTRLADEDGYQFLGDVIAREAYRRLIALLVYLETMPPTAVPESHRHSYIFDTYSVDGNNSAFTSSRGSTGRRNFFSPDNAARIDVILNQLRHWHQAGELEDPLLSVLLSVLISSVEKVSNTQGTYHDFPRGLPDSRSLRPLRLLPPAFDDVLGGSGGHVVGVEQDSLDFIKEVPRHQVLYADPPYNFRQYTAYYFLPNVLARYVTIADLADYFASVRYVRGQNPDDDFASTFSSPRQFMAALERLFRDASARWIVLSYFNGRNHWGSFKSEATDTIGYAKMTSLFRSNLFRPGSLRVIPIPRTNYQSYGGYRARMVDEYLFVGEKADGVA